MQTLLGRLRNLILMAGAIVCACESASPPLNPTNLTGPRYGGHGGGGTISAAVQLNGLDLGGTSCMGDDAIASGLVNGLKDASDIKCTSNDITLNSIAVTEYSLNGGISFQPVLPGQPISCQRGTTIFVHMFGTLEQTANSNRTDVGLWVSWDGGNALTGSCQQYSLTTGAPGILQSDGDLCGDLAPNTMVEIPFDVLALQCEDNGSGFMNVGTCIGWKNPGSDTMCPLDLSSAHQAYRFGTLPAQKSKCNCSSVQLPVVIND